MNVINVLLLCVTSSFLFPALTIAADNQSTEAATADVLIDPNCTASPEACRTQAIQRQERIERCTKDPQWCEQYKADVKKKREINQTLCKENPAFCEARQNLAQQCKQEPAKCSELRQAFKKSQEEAQQQWCTKNPERCAAWQQDQKELQEKCQEMRQQLLDKYSDRP